MSKNSSLLRLASFRSFIFLAIAAFGVLSVTASGADSRFDFIDSVGQVFGANESPTDRFFQAILSRTEQEQHEALDKSAIAKAARLGPLSGSVSLTTLGSAYTQNFDTLSNTAGSTTNNLTITGWDMTESGGGARDNEQYAVDTGGSTTGDTYSYGAAGSTERAFGALRSGTLIPLYGAAFTNNTGSTIGSLAIAYTGEEWRLGTAARTDQISFEYSTNATDLTTGTWTGVAALNFVTPDTATVGAKNGNAAADRTALSGTISGLNIPNGATFRIRWTDVDATGADDGLAVDDFSLTPNAPAPIPTNPTGTGAANPSSVTAGSSSLLTVTVTPGANPTSTALAVTADLTGIGGSATQAFFDDGTNGDVTSGDNIFSYTATVAANTSSGLKVLPAAITDGQARSSSANINLTVTSSATSPTVMGSANPSTVQAGNTTLLTATVTPGANPTSSGLTATVNLSSVGGSATQTFMTTERMATLRPATMYFRLMRPSLMLHRQAAKVCRSR